jgi:hypothetical protein
MKSMIIRNVRKRQGTLFGRCDHGTIDLSQPGTWIVCVPWPPETIRPERCFISSEDRNPICHAIIRGITGVRWWYLLARRATYPYFNMCIQHGTLQAVMAYKHAYKHKQIAFSYKGVTVWALYICTGFPGDAG